MAEEVQGRVLSAFCPCEPEQGLPLPCLRPGARLTVCSFTFLPPGPSPLCPSHRPQGSPFVGVL